jgi:hypothetical protein
LQPRYWDDELRVDDLNAVSLATDTRERHPLADPSTRSDDGSLEVVFRNIERRLIAEIDTADVVVGCVAWLTSGPILDALSETQGVSIVVQKEDFLRPDLGAPQASEWRRWLREKYTTLPEGPTRYAYHGTVVSELSYASDPNLGAVRCVGNFNSDRRAAMPRAHHKFLVFCDFAEGEVEELDAGISVEPGRVRPRKVWTGSFNLSKNGARSLENAVLMTDPRCVSAYYAEWAQLVGVSEPLDWTSEYVHPEFRIGS